MTALLVAAMLVSSSPDVSDVRERRPRSTDQGRPSNEAPPPYAPAEPEYGLLAGAAAAGLAAGEVDVAVLAARLLRLERGVQEDMQPAGAPAQLLFQVAAWLQHLRTATVAARTLGQPLSAFAEPTSNARTGTYFVEQLAAEAATAPWHDSVGAALQQVADGAAAAPETQGQLQDLLRRIDAVATALSG